VRHRARPRLPSRIPVHVTLRCVRTFGSLRRRAGYLAVRRALAITLQRRCAVFRVVHVSIQRDHLHLIVEATNENALARGLQGFSISFARGLNRRLGRTGRVLADRYHATQLRSPRQTRNAISYVLNNGQKHGVCATLFDPFSSALTFDGWAVEPDRRPPGHDLTLPTAGPVTWLLATGWRRHGQIAAR
jgi:REP element-mobilizing transposase RayT